MSITFSGVGSGLPVSDWIEQLMQIERQPVDKLYTKKTSIQTSKTALNSIQSKVSSLRSSIEKLTDANLASTFDLFAKRSATSSDTSVATAIASNNSAVQNITLKIQELATSTIAKTLDGYNVANLADGSTKVVDLGDKQGSEGTFSLYVNGDRKQFTIDENSTIDSVVSDINNAGLGITASIGTTGANKGKLTLAYNTSVVSSIQIGSNSDTSNFWNIMKMSTATPVTPDAEGNTSITSLSPLSTVDTSGTVTGTANLSQAVTEGTFTIGEAQFTIDENTTFSDLIAQINKDEDAGVTARYDLNTNKLMLTSKDPGKVAITLEDSSNSEENTSNFLTAMGLISGEDSTSSQTLGNNAKFYLNGSSTLTEATSNKITSDITGIAGVTINLSKAQEDDDEEVTISVGQDTSALTSALGDFITKFNDVINNVDTQTASTGTLKSEYSLVRLKNSLRQSVTSGVNGLNEYDNLAMIGITSGTVGTSTETSTKGLVLDTNKFLEALEDDPSQVKALLIGDSSKGITGILQTLEQKVESSLDATNGYFKARQTSMDRMMSDLDSSIKKGEARLEVTKTRLTNQFTQMDQLISQMQNQSSSLSSLGI